MLNLKSTNVTYFISNKWQHIKNSFCSNKFNDYDDTENKVFVGIAIEQMIDGIPQGKLKRPLFVWRRKTQEELSKKENNLRKEDFYKKMEEISKLKKDIKSKENEINDIKSGIYERLRNVIHRWGEITGKNVSFDGIEKFYTYKDKEEDRIEVGTVTFSRCSCCPDDWKSYYFPIDVVWSDDFLDKLEKEKREQCEAKVLKEKEEEEIEKLKILKKKYPNI